MDWSKPISEQSLKKIKDNLPAILEENPVMSRLEIAVRLGFRNRSILFTAATADPEIKRMLDEYDKEREPNLNELIRNTWTRRLIDDRAHPSEYIFFMMNKFPDEFQDKRVFRNMNLNGAPDDKAFRDEFFGLTGEKKA
jgi:hypothetical protein